MSTHLNGYNPRLVPHARENRRNMTPEESHLWYGHLSKHYVKFYRQRPIENFIADFLSNQASLVIELDGSQHFEENAMAYDAWRTKIMEQYGLRVIRFTNREVREDFRGVCRQIDMIVEERLKMKREGRGQGE